MKPVFFPLDIEATHVNIFPFDDLKLFLFDLFGLICQSGVEKGFPLAARVGFLLPTISLESLAPPHIHK